MEVYAGKTWLQDQEVIGYVGLQSGNREKLMLSNFFIFFFLSPRLLLLEWCQHLGWVFLPHLPQSRKSLTDMLRGCLLGDSRSSQVDKLTGDTYKYLGLP